MNQSIKALEELVQSINTASENAIFQFEKEKKQRDELIEAKRNEFQHSYQQLIQQLQLEMTNFENLKQIYEKIEVQDIDIRKKEEFENKTIKQNKNEAIEEYNEKLRPFYDLNNKKEKDYYNKTIESFKKRLLETKTAFEANENLTVLNDCKRQLNQLDENQWLENHHIIIKANELLKNQCKAIGAELENKIQYPQENTIKGLVVGTLYVKNEYLQQDWVYLENLQHSLKNNYKNQCIKLKYKETLNDYLIEFDDKKQLAYILRMLEFSTMIKSTEEAIHIYYDYEPIQSLFSLDEYTNCQQVKIDDTFVNQLKEEITQYPQQRISLFIENGQNLPDSFKELIVNKPENMQVIICHFNKNDQELFKNYIYLKADTSNREGCFIVNQQFDLFVNTINEQGIEYLKNLKPVEISKSDNFEKDFEDHLGKNTYFVGQNQELSMDDNYVIVTSNKQKGTLYLLQMLMQRPLSQNTHFIYYDDYSDHPLRKLIDYFTFEEIEEDVIEEMMDDFLEGDSFVILVYPPENMLGFAETLLDSGHILLVNDQMMDGCKNILLEEKEIEEFGIKKLCDFNQLDIDQLDRLLEDKIFEK